ncbi:hypothetical protein LTV02_13060 [Nocardia yamanashiensis]|uniref:hypothetical protein n=1 Tax=Nocardia yamanashiensis TaxID=209247 RepID=UPI001E2B2BCA|nr:hypothetical protein [Nocardia yamanashiensis]UGT44258.1 hypothetical protein LTV02_13060 [Nocardia yamanashiensis]
MVAFATLAMALTAAGSGHAQYAMLAGIICAATILFAITIISTTVHRDHVQRHNVPSLLMDSWEQSPAFATRRGAAPAIEPHQSA